MATIYSAGCAREDPCSWTGDYASLARAEYSHSRHSCARQRTLDARAQRMADKVQAQGAVDPSPCLHRKASHLHGTRACYVHDKCRCVPCRQAAVAYEQDRQRQHTYGRWDNYVDAEPVREHVRTLQSAGLGIKRVAAMAGVSSGSMSKLIFGKRQGDGQHHPSARVSKATAEKILAVPLPTVEALGASIGIDSTGTARRVQALCAVGWSVSAVADRTGVDRQPLDRALTTATISVKTALAVREVYEALWDQEPPRATRAQKTAASRSILRATLAGWAPPMAWDDDVIDDPHALPAPGWRSGECAEPGCPQTDVIAGGLCREHYDDHRHGERKARGFDLDEWVHLVHGGISLERAAKTMGVQLASVERAAHRNEHATALRLIATSHAA